MEKLHITDFRETIKFPDALGAGHYGDVTESVIQRDLSHSSLIGYSRLLSAQCAGKCLTVAGERKVAV